MSYKRSHMFMKLSSNKIPSDINNNRLKTKIRTPVVNENLFVQNSLTSKLIEPGDFVLVVVPEDLEIHGGVDPSLHGRIARVVTKLNNSDHIQIELSRCDVKNFQLDGNGAQQMSERLEITVVPSFCLALDRNQLKHRMRSPVGAEVQLPQHLDHFRSRSLPDTITCSSYLLDEP
ncbi:hypothetical protein AKO1_004132 [Acrasis kona]|uniref:Uncharacterized protein n=1 Tax=Acrasis kona TaxID=1008807 RepID=A0AAW2ZCI3_9EUKA